MFNNSVEQEGEVLTFAGLKKELRDVLSNPDKLYKLRDYFEDNRVNGSYYFGRGNCDNELSRAAAIINYLNTPSNISDRGLFSESSDNISIQCKLNAFHKMNTNANSIKFLEITETDDFVLALEDCECCGIKNERIEDFDLQDLVTISELS